MSAAVATTAGISYWALSSAATARGAARSLSSKPFDVLRPLPEGKQLVVRKDIFGSVDGEEVERYTLSNGVCSVQIITYGATLVSLEVPNREGVKAECSLNYSTLDEIVKGESYYGATCGRVANRIAKGEFKLNDESYQLAVNNGPNHLHGGIKGFDKYVWSARALQDASSVGVELYRRSEDGEEGYPGDIDVHVRISLDSTSALTFEYVCTNVSEDKATPVNLTNHTYYNLSNCERSIMDHKVKLHAHKYTPADEGAIPHGSIEDVEGPLDLTEWCLLRDKIPSADGFGRPGIDHNYVIDRVSDECVMAAELYDEVSGRYMSVETTEPGIQCYTMNWASEDPRDHPHTMHNAICFEAQHFPDSINKAKFPSTILRPGETYRQTTVHRFCTAD
eukprot:g293.t1